MDWKYLFTSFEGRIGRQQMWMGIIVLMVVSLVASVARHACSAPSTASTGYRHHQRALPRCVSIYPAVALYAKRWHDRGKSGWWTLIGSRAADRRSSGC